MTFNALEISRRRLSIALLTLCLAASVFQISTASPGQIAAYEKAGAMAGGKELWYPSEKGAPWQSRPAPGEGQIESLTTDMRSHGRLLLCRGGVVWMSQDGGYSWGSPIFGPGPEKGVAAVFHPSVPNVLFLATNERLLIGTKAGRDWMASTPSLKFKWRPQSILVSARKVNRMYIATEGDGVYRSDDAGHTWVAANFGLPRSIGAAPVASIESTVLDPTDPDVVYAAAEAEGVFKTTNGGRTWIRVSAGLPEPISRTSPWVLAIDPSNSRRLLVWASWAVHSERIDSAFFLSEDGATSWRKIAVGPAYRRVFAIRMVHGEVGLAVAVTEDGVIQLSKLTRR